MNAPQADDLLQITVHTTRKIHTRTDIQTNAGSTRDNRLTLTFDLLTPWSVHKTTLVLIAQAVFLL